MPCQTMPDLSAPLLSIRGLVSEGQPVHEALAQIASPFRAYERWSPLWDVLWEAQEGSPKVTLRDWDKGVISTAQRLALVDRAAAMAAAIR